VGAGDSACEEAHYLSKLCKSDDSESDKFRASKIMEERVRKTENIEILMNHDTIEVLGDEQVVTGVRALNKNTDEVFDIEATGFFVAIGHKPTDIFLKTFYTRCETGYTVYQEPPNKSPAVAFVGGDAADYVRVRW
jgi:thioredoxin reductase (NADPH)